MSTPIPIREPMTAALSDAHERASLAAIVATLGHDEVRVLRWLAERLADGARRYGVLRLETDARDWHRETGEECIDGLAYAAMGAVQGNSEVLDDEAIRARSRHGRH